MATIITRTGKGAPLTNTEVDANFTNLNADVASTQLQLAQTTAVAAANTSSIALQDLSAVSAALHRSPNAVTAMCLYETQKDSDGGAWTERMQHTSWYNEALNGAWRGAVASEAACRAISGATTGDYFQLTTDGKFYKLNVTSGVTEVFRGNTAKFPRLALIVAEALNVNIYDLTQPGRPMWMRFVGANNLALYIGSGGSANGLAALNGELVITSGTASGMSRMSFTKDASSFIYTDGTYIRPLVNITNRNTAGIVKNMGGAAIVASGTNAVAMTILPDAPIDVATGIQIPTIAVATAGGISIIQNNGTVSSETGSQAGPVYDGLQIAGKIVYYGMSGSNARLRFADLTKISGTTFSSTLVFAPVANLFSGSVLSTRLLTASANMLVSNAYGYPEIFFARLNRSLASNALNTGVIAKVSDKFSTGYMAGDIRRAYLCNTEVESVSGTELITNGTFDVDTSGWTVQAGSITVTAGQVKLDTLNSASSASMYMAVPTIIGKTYKILYDLVSSTGQNYSLYFFVETALGNQSGGRATVGNETAGTKGFLYTAVATTTYIRPFVGISGSLASSVTLDNISVRLAVEDRSYKAAGATIFGTLVKSVVA